MDDKRIAEAVAAILPPAAVCLSPNRLDPCYTTLFMGPAEDAPESRWLHIYKLSNS